MNEVEVWAVFQFIQKQILTMNTYHICNVLCYFKDLIG